MVMAVTAENAFAQNPVALILFHPRADGPLGSDDEMPSECDRDATFHEVRYDPANADSQTYQIYLNPFDTGSLEQWRKF